MTATCFKCLKCFCVGSKAESVKFLGFKGFSQLFEDKLNSVTLVMKVLSYSPILSAVSLRCVYVSNTDKVMMNQRELKNFPSKLFRYVVIFIMSQVVLPTKATTTKKFFMLINFLWFLCLCLTRFFHALFLFLLIFLASFIAQIKKTYLFTHLFVMQ